MFLGRVGGSTGPAHIVEARPDPLNIDGSVGTLKQLELKMYLKDPRPRGNQITVVSYIWCKVHFYKKIVNVA